MITEYLTEQLEASKLFEDNLILTYVPEAEFMSREEALSLAIERDREAAKEMVDGIKANDATKIARIMKELGY